MQVEFICFEFLDFVSQDGNQIKGINAWYLDPYVADPHTVGQKPQKKFINQTMVDQFHIEKLGKYEVNTNLSGKISSMRFIEK